MPIFEIKQWFDSGENLVFVLITYPNTKSQFPFATVIRFFHSSLLCTLFKLVQLMLMI
jgi:hypothetical protein